MIRDRLAKIVGAGNVSQKRAVLQEYTGDSSFVRPMKPDSVVRPRSVLDIKEIVKLANETLTPLVPVSSGAPHFKGGTVPGTGGALIVDLRGMKKIMRVDRNNRVAMCEPGVTFDELIAAAEKEGLRLNMPLLPRKSKSVIGSMLEREPVTMPGYHWDIADPLGCLEIVFGTGDMFRTGSAAGPGTIEEQWALGLAQTEAAGPQQASWYRLIQGAQGTMGIVAWATMRCELLPKIEEPFLAGSSDLNKILEFVHWLVRLRLVRECLVLNASNMAAIMATKRPDDYRNAKSTLPPWMLFFNIAGYEYLPEERVCYQTEDMNEIARRIGLNPARTVAKISAYELLKVVQKPSEEPYWKLRSKGACHDIFFLTVYDKVNELIDIVSSTADKLGYPASDIGIYLQPIVQGTSCHCEFSLFYDPENATETELVKNLSEVAMKNLVAHGAFFSRPYGESARTILNRDAATSRALLKIKTMFDPNDIMNPGKLCF